jgi:hypothetical protein
MDASFLRQQQSRFRKTWPPGKEYTMSGFTYFNKKFMQVHGYNWWLLPCVNSEGEPRYIGAFPGGEVTVKFTKSGSFTSTTIVSTTPRIGVLVETSEHLYHVYVDENAQLFIHVQSNVCVGRVGLTDDMWDGTVLLDTETLQDYSDTVCPTTRCE